MSTRSNGGIIGPQNRTTSAYANGVWHIYDAQQSVYARTWPGFVPVAPQAPGVGTVTLGSGSQAAYLTATIPFTAFYDGGNTVTKATAVSIPGGLTANTNGSSPITISGLTSNTNYTFAVFLTNYYGNSPYGYSSPVKTASVPAAPTIGTATLSVGASVNVAYTTNSNGGAPITSVTAISTPGNITATGNSSPILVTGLSGSTAYTFQVYATNVMGNSALSSASNSVTTPNIVNIAYLLVAGAGGGAAGGGGAGGLLSGTYSATPGTSYTIVPGGGGAGLTGPGVSQAGTSTTGFGLTAVGGGAAGYQTNTGLNGGSGGGAGYYASNSGGLGTAGQGNNGGSLTSSGALAGGGGGGAGAAGGDCTASGVGANGGIGAISTIITSAQATTYSVGQVSGGNVYFAGGGGGGCYPSGTTTGGLGGGAGGAASGAAAGTQYTGGGGGGIVAAYPGGNGGSGVAILSVPTAKYTGTYTGSPNIFTNGSNTILIFKGTGSYTA
jgi:hypothetical protein